MPGTNHLKFALFKPKNVSTAILFDKDGKSDFIIITHFLNHFHL